MSYCYDDLAQMIDHALLHPMLTDAELEQGCRMAEAYRVASVCVKPYFVRRAAELLAGSDVRVGTVIGFPHGSSPTEVKRFETEFACREGAVEVDMVINVGKALSGDWEYVRREIRVVCDEAHRQEAKVKVILETDFLAAGGGELSAEELKIKLCQLAKEAGADWVKTSTGFGFVQQDDGTFQTEGATDDDLTLMRQACSPQVQVKASGGIRSLDELIRVRELGATRCGASATQAILDECRAIELGQRGLVPGEQIGPSVY